ncbi:MAG TPA: M20/M25/M40 family metallo-hydrolase [Bacteroidales bacterium]|nr:M20/M25/M40 family metallo-hydrolase [Bacteroidales bacterium]
MKRFITLIVFTAALSSAIIFSQSSPVEKGLKAINQDVLKAQLGFLASDWTEGRETGQRGEYISSDYIASMLQLYGVKPGGDYPQSRDFPTVRRGNERTYFQNFVLLKISPGKEHILKLKSTEGISVKTNNFTYNVDFTIRPYDSGVEIEAPIVFAGYGFKNDKLKYNDFSKLDVKGKFILKISGTPGFARETLSPAELSAASAEMENLALSLGAVGIIEFNPKSTTVGNPERKDFMNLSPSENNPGSGRPYARYSIPARMNRDNLIRVVISVKTANEILKGSGIKLDDYIKRADSKPPDAVPALTGKSIYFKSSVEITSVAVRNVIGVIEGNNPDQIIVLGAHYDHMGTLNGYIWNGADDNASGTVGVMTLAKAIIETGIKPEKTIIIALWTAEEQGLLGSRYYVDNMAYPIKNLRLNVNFDMISRYIADDDKNKVIMTFSASRPEFTGITEDNLRKYDIDLKVEYQPSNDPPGGSDHRSFVAAGIPIMRFKPGHREEYHTPGDETNTVNFDIMEKIVKISFANIWELANSKW